MTEAPPDIATTDRAITIRPARAEEKGALDALIAASARALGRGFYSEAESEAAIAHVFGVDSELVADGSYFVIEVEGEVAGCGGWSRRATLYGGDRFIGRSSALLDPATDAARIRAFFIAPGFARMGLATRLLRHCEEAARAAGFTRMALMATMPGVPFYRRHGYLAGAEQASDFDGVLVSFAPMEKSLLPD